MKSLQKVGNSRWILAPCRRVEGLAASAPLNVAAKFAHPLAGIYMRKGLLAYPEVQLRLAVRFHGQGNHGRGIRIFQLEDQIFGRSCIEGHLSGNNRVGTHLLGGFQQFAFEVARLGTV